MPRLLIVRLRLPEWALTSAGAVMHVADVLLTLQGQGRQKDGQQRLLDRA